MVEDIDIVEAHPFETLIKAGDQVFTGAKIPIRSGPHAPASFGRDDQLISVGFEILGENGSKILFGRSWWWTVVVGQIEMGDAQIKGPTQHGAAVFEGIHPPEVVP